MVIVTMASLALGILFHVVSTVGCKHHVPNRNAAAPAGKKRTKCAVQSVRLLLIAMAEVAFRIFPHFHAALKTHHNGKPMTAARLLTRNAHFEPVAVILVIVVWGPTFAMYQTKTSSDGGVRATVSCILSQTQSLAVGAVGICAVWATMLHGPRKTIAQPSDLTTSQLVPTRTSFSHLPTSQKTASWFPMRLPTCRCTVTSTNSSSSTPP
mmetsp:Transcript_51198/g.119426  ORF Transcript_51198/g.119426 Transcript_51198/m.119426 type:complete len:210 (+) Transcript_51198:242-871(+)